MAEHGDRTMGTAQPLAASKNGREPCLVRSGGPRPRYRTFGASPGSRASKVFNTEAQGGRRGHGGEGFWRFARAPIQHRAKRHSVLLRGPQCPRFAPPCLKTYLLALDRQSGPGIDGFRLTNTKTGTSRNGRAANDPGGNACQPMCYRRFIGNSSRAAVIGR